jgi:hypothetical protein
MTFFRATKNSERSLELSDRRRPNNSRQFEHRRLGPIACLSFAAVALFGCSEALTECVGEYSACLKECPSAEEEQASLAEADSDYADCREKCPSPGADLDAALKCEKRCLDDWQSATEAATQCRDSCVDEFTECVADLSTCDPGSSSCSRAVPSPPPPSAIQQLAPNLYAVDRTFASTLANDQSDFFDGVRLAPERVGSSGLGLRFVSLHSDSLAVALGAREGDILWRAAGAPVTGANVSALVAERLVTTGSVQVVVLRNQMPQPLTYRLR